MKNTKNLSLLRLTESICYKRDFIGTCHSLDPNGCFITTLQVKELDFTW